MKKIIIYLLIGVLLGAGGTLAYNKFFAKKEVKKETKTQEVEEKTNKEEELTDTYIKEDISKKTSEILTLGTNTTDEKYIIGVPYSGRDMTKKELLNIENNEKTKIYTAIRANDLMFENITEEDLASVKNISAFSNWENYQLTEVKKISSKEIEKKYEELFNQKPNHQDIDTDCPHYFYKNNNYYEWHECGGTAYPELMIYKNKYTKKGNKIYSYVYLGTYSLGGKIYKDILDYDKNTTEEEYEELLKKLEYVGTVDEDNVINENNYKEFTKYKLSFNKSEKGKYYFESIEQVK